MQNTSDRFVELEEGVLLNRDSVVCLTIGKQDGALRIDTVDGHSRAYTGETAGRITKALLGQGEMTAGAAGTEASVTAAQS